MDVRHRKNAAEWVMYAVLLPFVPVARLIERVRGIRNNGMNAKTPRRQEEEDKIA